MKAVENLAELGKRFKTSDELQEKVQSACRTNPWFIAPFVQKAMDAIADEMLAEKKLSAWLSSYPMHNVNKTIGLIFAGNVPLVGFHDFLCCYAAGCKMKIKLSSKDDKLFPLILKMLAEIDSEINSRVEFADTLKNFDAVIATGSDNTNRQFEYYFRSYPKILRRNRNSIAILHGNETPDELVKLSDDIFLYFGFGCRNISKIYMPKDYDLTQLFPAFERDYKWLHDHNKYMNNYDYNRTLLMLNKTPHFLNEFVILVQSPSIPSPIATLHYEYWEDTAVLNKILQDNSEKIQCVVSNTPERWNISSSVRLGQSQYPALHDYSDGIDTLNFLLNLS